MHERPTERARALLDGLTAHAIVERVHPYYNGFQFEGEWLDALKAAICDELDEVDAKVPGTWVNPAWERWHKSLKHDEVKSIGDAVEQLMYEAIEFGGDMGPNGNTYNGIDEGDVLTAGFINEWVKRFENMLGPGTCKPVISDNLTESEGTGDAWADCSACGHLLFVLTDPNSQPPNYCPNCGRLVERGDES